MDATQSNRLARALLAGSAGISQMMQTRMQMANAMFRDRLAQAKVDATNAATKQRADEFAQTGAQKKADAAQRAAEFSMRSKQTDAAQAETARYHNAEIQRMDEQMKMSAARTDMEMRKLDQSLKLQGKALSAADMKNAIALQRATQSTLSAMGPRIAADRKVVAAWNSKAAVNKLTGAKMPAEVGAAMADMQALTQQQDALSNQVVSMTNHINDTYGEQPPAAKVDRNPANGRPVLGQLFRVGPNHKAYPAGAEAPGMKIAPDGANPMQLPEGSYFRYGAAGTPFAPPSQLTPPGAPQNPAAPDGG